MERGNEENEERLQETNEEWKTKKKVEEVEQIGNDMGNWRRK